MHSDVGHFNYSCNQCAVRLSEIVEVAQIQQSHNKSFIVLQRLKEVSLNMKSSFSLLTFNLNLRSCTENAVQVRTSSRKGIPDCCSSHRNMSCSSYFLMANQKSQKLPTVTVLPYSAGAPTLPLPPPMNILQCIPDNVLKLNEL